MVIGKFISIYVLAVFLSASLVDFSFAHEGKEIQTNQWNPISAGPVTTWTAPLCQKGKLVVQPFFFYNKTRGTLDNEGNYNSLPGDDKKYQFQQQLFAQFGLTDNLEIDGQTVYQENFIRRGGDTVSSKGFGDSYLFLRYCFIEEEEKTPHLSGLFQLKLPTGKYQKLDTDKLGTDSMGATSGGGSYDPGFGINLTKRLKPFVIHVDTIYNLPHETKVNGVETKYGTYLNYDFGVEYFLTKSFNLMLEFNGFLQADKREDGTKIPSSDINYFTIAPGIGYSTDKIQTLLAYQRTLTGTNTDANDSAVLTFVYTF